MLRQATEGTVADGEYKGTNNYIDYRQGFRREHTIGNEKGSGTHGPLRASANVRMSVRYMRGLAPSPCAVPTMCMYVQGEHSAQAIQDSRSTPLVYTSLAAACFGAFAGKLRNDCTLFLRPSSEPTGSGLFHLKACSVLRA